MDTENVDIILEGLDDTNITSILNKWKEINAVKKKLEQLDEMMRTKIKTYLRERKWERYLDNETKIGVTITKQKREILDKKQLKLIISDAQLAQITRVTTYERLNIVTPETRKRLKKYVANKTKTKRKVNA